MEVIIPLLSLGGLYIVSNQERRKRNKEQFTSLPKEQSLSLPNTDIPNRNYPDEMVYEPAADLTSQLSNFNGYERGGVYTDRFFNKQNALTNQMPMTSDSKNNPSILNSGQNYYSMTGEIVNASYFEHNNQQPFFGSKHHDIHQQANTTESFLDNMNGSGSQDIVKREQSPMFAPETNVNWAYGTPNASDFIQSRMNVSQRMDGVKLFEEQRVAPGLGVGAGTEGVGGYNSGMFAREQWLDRTVDEMRVANKPKASGISMYGHEGPANSYIKSMANIGRQEKNRVETAFEMGQDRLFTTTGAEKGTILIPVGIARQENRPEQSREYHGGAGYNVQETYVDGEYHQPRTQNLGSVPLTAAYANGRQNPHENDYSLNSNQVYMNNRVANGNETYFGILGTYVKEMLAPILDIARPSRKETTVSSMRPFNNPKSIVNESYYFDPTDTPQKTIKELTEHANPGLGGQMNRISSQNGMGYTRAEQQPIQNARMLTSDFFYSGNGGAVNAQRQRDFEAEYQQRNNDLKSSTNVGYRPSGNMNLFQGDIGVMRQDTRDYVNQYKAMPTMPSQTASQETMGKMSNTLPLYQGLDLDRNNGDVLNQLKGNPYALSITHNNNNYSR